MARYPLLEEPLQPGLTTLRRYGRRIDRSADYIRTYWGCRNGFPSPAGELPARGRQGGGRGELVYDEGALDDFRITQSDLWGRQPGTVAVPRELLDSRVTPREFADLLVGGDHGLVARYEDQDSAFPAADADGRFRLASLAAYWNTRPRILIPAQDRQQLVTLGYFANNVVGWDRKTVTQYRSQLPAPDDCGRYWLGVLADFFNHGRPGKRGPAASGHQAA